MQRRYSLTIDPKLMDSLEFYAEREGLSKSKAVEFALSRWLRAMRKQELDEIAAEGYL